MAQSLVVFPRNAILFLFMLVFASVRTARGYSDLDLASAHGGAFVAFTALVPQFAPDMPSDFTDVNSTLLDIGSEPSDTQKEARQRRFNPGTSVVIGIIAAFGFLQSTPRAAVLMSL
mmetsp:Transcript_23574/g.36932  ORF Transcript_23574/g.36932 Transcript_23574/m.36932 type:complete len:117 (+) Transcript_23574:82-432(+)|eukprot:CAMPEP_0169124440 /NCGR_PEP_ID=MMETSP1015-20121227/34325_1 /TAXON_ID=342587 /ORGANISM="Karlodinium micrum, Strain CCMP2283" /LENGTH=116 /DNA_ID=CAMNT_0009187855 /DNA_START=80 /DNA_END=430 /DNA_ORIENTATION=+